MEPFIVGTSDKPLRVLGEQVSVLASHATTGSYEVLLHVGGEGSGPPPHAHDWDESFYLLEGGMELRAGDRVSTVRAGELAFVPRGTLHSFRLLPGGAKYLAVTSHGSVSEFFSAIDREIGYPPDIPKLGALATAHGVRIAPPPRAP